MDRIPRAFPAANYVPEYGGTDPGMTLRDWFAGQALSGYMAHYGAVNDPEAAKVCFALADVMLAARAAS